MSEPDDKVFDVVCPHCGTVIWVDGEVRGVLKAEKGAAKRKASFDDLLLKEKKKVEGMATKFEATAALDKQKKDKAKEAFEKAFRKAGED
jgi:adenine-specific DNA methylase